MSAAAIVYLSSGWSDDQRKVAMAIGSVLAGAMVVSFLIHYTRQVLSASKRLSRSRHE